MRIKCIANNLHDIENPIVKKSYLHTLDGLMES